MDDPIVIGFLNHRILKSGDSKIKKIFYHSIIHEIKNSIIK